MQKIFYFLYVIYMSKSYMDDLEQSDGKFPNYAQNDYEKQVHAKSGHKRKHEEYSPNETSSTINNCSSQARSDLYVDMIELEHQHDYINNFFEQFVDFLNKNVFKIIIRLVSEINESNLRLLILEKYQIIDDVLLPQKKGLYQIESRTIGYTLKNSDNTVRDKYIIYGLLVYHTWLFLRENPNINFEAKNNIFVLYNMFTNFIENLSDDMHEAEFLIFFESLDNGIINATTTELSLYKDKYDPLSSYCSLLKKFCLTVIKILLDKWRNNGANIFEYNFDNHNDGFIVKNCKYEDDWKMITSQEMETKIETHKKSMTSLKKTQENMLINIPKILESVKKGIKEQTSTQIILDFELNEIILSSVLGWLDYLVVHTEKNLQNENLEKLFFDNPKISAFLDAFELLLVKLKKMIDENIHNNEIKKEDVKISIFIFDVILLENFFEDAKYRYIKEKIWNELTYSKIFALCNKIKMDFYTKLIKKTIENRFLSCILYLFDLKDLGKILKGNNLIFNDIANDHTYNHSNSQMLDYTNERKQNTGQGFKYIRFFDQSFFGHILNASSNIKSKEFYANLVCGEREIKNKKSNSFKSATETVRSYDKYKNIKPIETNNKYISSHQNNSDELYNMTIQASSVHSKEISHDKTCLSIEQEHVDVKNFGSASYIQKESLQDISSEANEKAQTDKPDELSRKDFMEKKANDQLRSENDTVQLENPSTSHAYNLKCHFENSNEAIQAENVNVTEQTCQIEQKKLKEQFSSNDSNFQNEQEQTRRNYLSQKDEILYQQSLLREQQNKLRRVFIQKQRNANKNYNLREKIYNQKLQGLQEQISTHKNQQQNNQDYFNIMFNLNENLIILEENHRYEQYNNLIIYYNDEVDFANEQHIYNEKIYDFEKQLLIKRNEFNKRSFKIEKKFQSEQKLLRIKYHALKNKNRLTNSRNSDQRK